MFLNRYLLPTLVFGVPGFWLFCQGQGICAGVLFFPASVFGVRWLLAYFATRAIALPKLAQDSVANTWHEAPPAELASDADYFVPRPLERE